MFCVRERFGYRLWHALEAVGDEELGIPYAPLFEGFEEIGPIPGPLLGHRAEAQDLPPAVLGHADRHFDAFFGDRGRPSVASLQRDICPVH